MISESTERGKIDDIKTRLVVVKNNFIDVIMQMNKKTETLESIGSEEPMEMSGVRDLRDLTPQMKSINSKKSQEPPKKQKSPKKSQGNQNQFK